MKYIKPLDGIRGLAILLVVVFHWGYFEFGWIGVQAFFVLSGYLITHILSKEKSKPFDQYLKRFHWRRMLRVFPLYFAFLLILSAVYCISKRPPGFATEWPFLLTYTINFARMRAQDTSGYVCHLWSLAVDEQFYLVWPLLVYACSTRAFKKVLIATIVAAPLFRLALAVGLYALEYETEHVGRIIYSFPLSHFDAFAAGAAVAVFPSLRLKRATAAFVLGGAAVCLLGLVSILQLRSDGINAIKSLGYPIYMAENYQFVWGYTAINLFFALAIVGALQSRPLFNLLNTPFLVRMGKISYGLYVFHLPVFLLVFSALHRYAIPMGGLRGLAVFVASFAVVLLMSEISFRFFESRFLALKDRAFVFPRESPSGSE